MYVAETNILPPSGMRVRVFNLEGQDYIFDISSDMKVDTLKIKTLGMKGSLYHKILQVRTGKILNEEKTLAQEDVCDNDELILLKKRLAPPKYETKDSKEDNKSKITGEIVRKATSALPVTKRVMPTPSSLSTADFQSELRKILVSLIEASQKILCLNPEASKIFKQAEEMLKEANCKESSVKTVDPSLLKQLTDMGFPEARAKKALLLNKMSVMSAMDWMIKHESDEDIDQPLPGMEEEDNTLVSDERTEGAMGGVELEENSNSQTSPHVTNILQSLKAFRKRGFKPSPRALQNLVEMGFEEKDAVDALRVGRNDQDTACDWLLGDRKTRPMETEEGMDTSGPIFKAIMANPTVQLGLNNPRCLLAFLQMLESPLMMHQWLNDPETGPLLVQISRIYHSEKNSTCTTEAETNSEDSSPSSSYIPERVTSLEQNSLENSPTSATNSGSLESRLVSDSRSLTSPGGASNFSSTDSVSEASPVRARETTRLRPERDAGTPVTLQQSSSGKPKTDSKSKGR